MRALLLVLFLFGVLGAGSELILLSHYEDPWQLVPLGMMVLSLAILFVRLFRNDACVLRIFQVCMLLFVAAGVLGVYLHYQSNVEFELEMNPAAAGWELIRESLTGAMPALAPGTMVYLGLIGLLYTWRHPIFSASRNRSDASVEINAANPSHEEKQ
ncbi:MAG: hypothetical protein F4Z69_04630 [Bacteroidetes bacterium SB0668_bin_1]|nr:hypothetical protein [Bacteroidetes bacterium SB0668_bin_1]